MTALREILEQDTVLEPVTASNKQSWFFLASVLIGVTICVPVFVLGAQLAQATTPSVFIAATLCGGAFAALSACITGYVGQRSGLSTAMLIRHTFGTYGAVLANMILALCAFGWFGVQIGVFSQGLVDLAQKVWGVELNLLVVQILSGLVMSSTAVIGFRGLGKLSYIATPLLLILLITPAYILLQQGAFSNFAGHSPENAMTFGTVVATIWGIYSFSMTMPDLTRFMRSAKAMIAGNVANFFVAYPLLILLTGSVAIAAGESDFMTIMITLGFGSLAIVTLFLSTWTTNDTNLYVSALSLNVMAPAFKRWQVTIIAGLLGTLTAILGIFDHYIAWVIFVGNTVGPMAVIYTLDYFFQSQRYIATEKAVKFRFMPIAIWLAGFFFSLCTTEKNSLGLELFKLTSIPLFDGMLASAILYIATVRFWRDK